MSAVTKVRIGTRGSALALWQARHVAARLGEEQGIQAELRVIRTRGDAVQDRPFGQIEQTGGKGLFTKEIEDALLANEVDLAVHSIKDLPTTLPPGLALGAVTAREDPRDALVARGGATLDRLPQGAVVGTSSLRRAAQLLALRPDLRIVPLRGNVDTRVRKVDGGTIEAAVLALAGLRRLGLEGRVTELLPADRMIPAPGQGALGIEIRAGDEAVAARVARLHDERTAAEVAAERALLARLDGGCQTPVAAHASVGGGRLVLDALVASLDGRELLRGRRTGDADQAAQLGSSLGDELLGRGAGRILAAARAASTPLTPQGAA